MNRLLLVILSLVLAVPVWAKEPLRTVECMVERVVDGDTINAIDRQNTKLKIRLYGIDAPETEKRNRKSGLISKQGQPHGEEATAALNAKVRNAVITVDIMDVDRYKRMVGVIKIGNRNINREIVQEGHAWAYKSYLSAPYRSEFIGAEEQARSKGLGLWKETNPEPPWEFRKRMKVR